MRVSKILCYNIVCPNCGSKITLSGKEYRKYLDYTSENDIANEIICTEKVPDETEEVEVTRHYFPCPACNYDIQLEYCQSDSDKYGFKVPSYVDLLYDTYEAINMDDFLQSKYMAEEDEGEENEN